MQSRALAVVRSDDTLELAFETISLRTICENEARARRELGPAVAQALKRRLGDMRAAPSAADLIAGQPRYLDADDLDSMAVDLCDGHRLVYCANHSTNPMTDTGKPDRSMVSRIRLLRIERDHG